MRGLWFVERGKVKNRSGISNPPEGISDGVFAVSLTLLILDVRPPEGGVSQLVHGVVRSATFLKSFDRDIVAIIFNRQAAM